MVPILATPFNADDTIDFPSLKRLIDWLIGEGVDGVATLANASEGHLLDEDEKKRLAAETIRFVDGRVPVVVSISHFGAKAAAAKAQWAEQEGARCLLTLPPFFGRWRSGVKAMKEYLHCLADASGLPIMLQDHPLTDIELRPSDLCELIRDVPRLDYLKMEVDTSPVKVRQVLADVPASFRGILTGMGGVRLFWELDAGAVGCMPACIPAKPLADIIHLHWEGRRDEAFDIFRAWLPFIDFMLRLGRRDMVKEYLAERGIFTTTRMREPNLSAWNDWCREEYRYLLGRIE
jgi:dihydrodipicolinate synthase/N-acetylneuraminate lyase